MRATTIFVGGLAVFFGGCGISVRQPAKNATLGALDAFDSPPGNAELATKIGKLANRYVDEALAAEQPPTVEELAANATRGALRVLGQTAAEYEPMLRGALSDSLRMATRTLAEQGPVIERIAGRAGQEAATGVVHGFGQDKEALVLLHDAALGAGRAVTSGATEELARRTEAWVGPGGQGPLGNAIAAIAARSAEFAVAGALTAIRRDVQTCVPGRGELCLPELTRSLSRSAGLGATEAIAREFDWATAGIAFATGLAAAVLAGFALNALRDRQRMRV